MDRSTASSMPSSVEAIRGPARGGRARNGGARCRGGAAAPLELEPAVDGWNIGPLGNGSQYRLIHAVLRRGDQGTGAWRPCPQTGDKSLTSPGRAARVGASRRRLEHWATWQWIAVPPHPCRPP